MRSRTRSLACESKKAHEQVTTGSPSSPAFPAQWFTAYSVLSSVTGLFCHRRLQVISRKLDPSVGGTGPHDFAVRVGIARLATPFASIASRLAFVTTRSPLLSRRDSRRYRLIWAFRKSEYFCERGWTRQKHQRHTDLPVGAKISRDRPP